MDFRENAVMSLGLVGFLVVVGEVSSNYDQTYNGYTYILPENIASATLKLNFSEAQEWCRSNIHGAVLASIETEQIQNNIDQFLKSAVREKKLTNFDSVRVNGKSHLSANWSWVNGHEVRHFVYYRHEDGMFQCGSVWSKDYTLFALPATIKCYYICEILEINNSEYCALQVLGRCYQTIHRKLTWYEARNDCFKRGGDLASFENTTDQSLNTALKMFSFALENYYWIGIRLNTWTRDDTGTAIKYTRWNYEQPSYIYNGQCLCLNQSFSQKYDWKWSSCRCDTKLPLICALDDNSKKARTTNYTQQTEAVVETTGAFNPTLLPMTKETASGHPFSLPSSKIFFSTIDIIEDQRQKDTIGLSVGVSVCLLIIFLVIVVLAVCITRKRKKSRKPNPRPYEERVVETSVDANVYANIQTPVEAKSEKHLASNAVYASIVPQPSPTEESLKKKEYGNQSNQVIYAELDLETRNN